MIDILDAIMEKHNTLQKMVNNDCPSSNEEYIKIITTLVENRRTSIQRLIDSLSYEEKIHLHSQMMVRPYRYIETIAELEATMDETQLTASRIVG